MDFVCNTVSGLVIEVGKLLCRHVGQPIRPMFKFNSNVKKLKEEAKKLTEKKEKVLRDVEEARSREDIIKPEVQEWLDKVDKFTNRLANVTSEENKKCFKGCPNLKTRFDDSKEAVELVNECDPLLTEGNFQSVFCKNHARELKEREKELTDRKETVRHAVEEAERKGDTIEAEVRGWLAEVDGFINRLKNVTNEENKKCFKGCPNLKTRFVDNMKAADLVKECDHLLAQGIFPRIAYRSLPRRTRSMYVKEDYAFDSREAVFEDVMETLKNTDVKAIGVYGMGGVGKTTLVNKVYFHAKEDGLFDQVVMAEVTQNSDIIKIQEAIADDLGLVFTENTERKRADRLREQLKKEKSVLVILDDVWKELKLDAIGIPVRTANCKLLLTSRDLRVCNSMKTEKNIPVMPLTSEEALTLFWKVVDDSEKHSQLGSIATEIVEKCAGLPVAILAIAKTLKGSENKVWKKVSKELGKSGAVPDFRPVLKLSYDYLQNEEAKSLFLLFSLHEVGHPVLIDHLVQYVIGLGFLPAVTTLKATRDEVDQLIKELKNASLLLDSDRKDEVKMHDVIHVVAKEIASSKEHKMFNIQDVVHLDEELEKEIYKDSTAISLHHGEVPMLLEKLDLPQLKLLLLNSKGEYVYGWYYRSYLKIPDHFFDGMKELRVLVLNGIRLRSFIPSLNYESNIRTLSLECYNLENITKVGKLKKLEVLTVSSPHHDVERLPEEIGDLTRLKLLDLERCHGLEVIPPDVISKLTRLEELYVGDSFVNWDTPGNASLIELKQLHDLNILNIHIMNAAIIPQDFFPEKLERFKIVIGAVRGPNHMFDGVGERYMDYSKWKWINKFDEVRQMCLRNTNYLRCGVEKFLQKTEVLFLYGIDGIRNVHPDLGGKGFPNLKHLRIDDNPDILHIIKHEDDCYRPFHMLESLFLHNLNKLEILRHGDSREEPFRKLKVIKVNKCAALTQLISSSMTRLEKIKVMECDNLTEIVYNDVPDDNFTISEVVFTKLHSLTLARLPKLMNFGPTAISRTLENIQEADHDDLKSLFDNKVSFPSLKNLTLSDLNIPNIWCNQLSFPSLKNLTLSNLNIPNIWGNQLPSSYSFGETLTRFYVAYCPHLKFLFSSSMVSGLQQLEELTVAYCESMEVIINKEGSRRGKVCDSLVEILDVPEGSSSKAVIMFPKLTKLSLSSLDNLKSFYHGLHITEWPSLKELTVEFCDKVEIFGSKYQSLCEEKQSVSQPLFIVNEDAFPRLETLQFWANDNLKEIWHGGGIISKKLWFSGKTNIIKFPHYLLPTDTMDITSGYFKQIGGGSDNTFAVALRQLRTLIVRHDDDDSLHESFESSDSLAYLVSSWVSFQNLTNLEINHSRSGFRYLLTYSTATSLQYLTRLNISYCKNIEAIIMPPIDEVNDKIVFSQLKYLELQNLESLTNFYSGSHTLEFPSLEEMIVDRCPNMKVFSKGNSITPELQRIQLEKYYDDDDKCRWEGDLNSTIQKMFKEMVGFDDLYELRLSKVPHLREIWHGQLPFSFFGELSYLTVDKCADMSSAIPLNLLPCLKSLYRLTIEDCDSLEEVIHMEGLDVDDQSVLLPKLTRIRLIELPRLRNICSKRQLEILRLTDLLEFFVSKCHSLQYIFTTNIILDLGTPWEVEIRDCAMVETIITEDREKDAAMSDTLYPSLHRIILESLPKLTCFHSGSSVLECSSLQTMTINDCPQMKTFVFTSTEDYDLQDTPLLNEKVSFPLLYKLKLSKLPMVEHLCSEPCRAFQCLETLEISECVNLKSLVPYSASLQSLTTLKVSQCDGLTSLMTLKTAKSLKQLARINVANCKIMREIITHIHTEDEENGRVVFGQLEYIGLQCLPNISGFYLGEYTIDFPALEQVVVRQCQKMNTFSKGVVSTPNLTRVQYTEDEEEERWQNDLNTTIQLLFKETNVQSQKED